MSDSQQTPDSGIQVSFNPQDKGQANLVYILYLVGLLVGLTGIIGVIMAYVAKDQADPVLKSHYDHQIAIFWKGFVYLLVGTILSFVLIGIFVLLWWAIWMIINVVRGMQTLSRGEPMAKSAGWGL